MFDAPAGAQMSFFPSEAEQIQSIAEAESVTPSAFSMFISQDDIDHILRTGGNADAARMKIAAEFSKQKPLEDRAAFLKALYHGGNGLITDNGRFSAWYDRAFHILAITVCQADWDRRYSPDNRAWANAMSIPANPDAWGTDRNCYLAVNSHPGLVDLFLSQTRKAYAQEQQKTSVRDMLKKLPETTSPKISAKSKSPER